MMKRRMTKAASGGRCAGALCCAGPLIYRRDEPVTVQGPVEETATRRTTCPRTHGEAGGGRPERGGGVGSKDRKTTPTTTSTTPGTRPTGPRERRNDTTRNAGRSGRPNAARRRSTRRERRVTVQGPARQPQHTATAQRECPADHQNTGRGGRPAARPRHSGHQRPAGRQ